MNAETALAAWSTACSQFKYHWYLFSETLLCAEGYHHFPETLDHAHIAVLGEEFPSIVAQVFPLLPTEWIVDKDTFCRGKRTLVFQQGRTPMLELSVLYGTQSEDQLTELTARAKQLLQPVNRLRPWNVLCNLFPLGKQTVGKLLLHHIQHLVNRIFPQVVDLIGNSGKNAVFYYDALTSETPVCLPASSFDGTNTLLCDEIAYPVFTDYQDYLAEVFGDYESGLTDEIGCGLTAGEKVALKDHQARCFEALTFLQQLSEELNLRYYLLAGSVLGCVRHGGFIPWDDDIDVGIRIEELECFEEAVKELLPVRLPEGFTLVQPGADTLYPRMFSKICYDGRCCIDLWPLVPTYDGGLRAKTLWRFGKLITRVHYKKIGHPIGRLRKLVALVDPFLTDKMVMKLARWNERKYMHRSTPAYINLYSIYRLPEETIQRRWLDTNATAMFNGLEVPVVGCTEEYLTHLYGDYMAKPAPWKRASRHVARFLPANDRCIAADAVAQ